MNQKQARQYFKKFMKEFIGPDKNAYSELFHWCLQNPEDLELYIIEETPGGGIRIDKEGLFVAMVRLMTDPKMGYLVPIYGEREAQYLMSIIEDVFPLRQKVPKAFERFMHFFMVEDVIRPVVEFVLRGEHIQSDSKLINDKMIEFADLVFSSPERFPITEIWGEDLAAQLIKQTTEAQGRSQRISQLMEKPEVSKPLLNWVTQAALKEQGMSTGFAN